MAERLRLLLVEDVEDDAALVLLELRRAGFEPVSERVETAAAMRSALERPWDLVISDYSLPEFGAPRALEILQQGGKDIPLIIVSGTVNEVVAVDSLRAGARDFVSKDRLARLAPAVRRELRELEARRRLASASEGLRRAEERFRLLAEVSEDVIWDWDVGSDALWVSPAWATLFGHPTDALDHATWAESIHPADRARVEEQLRELLAGAQDNWRSEYRYLRADGGASYVLDRGTVIRDADGRAVRMVGTMIDMTERNALEEQLRRSQRMEAIGQLSGGIAHDFNNMLAVIASYSELLINDTPEGDPKREDLAEIRRAANSASTLTRQLLAFSRRQILQPVVLDVNEVVTGLTNILGRTLGERVELVVVLHEAPGLTRADRGQVEQVLMNLAVNARDAMPRGGKLTLTTAPVAVRGDQIPPDSAAEPGDYVALRVADEGIGMSPEVVARIFEPFFTTKEPGSGTGLGLSTVYGIVQQSKGIIRVESAPWRGTAFEILLPRVGDRTPDQRATPRPPAAERSGSETILLVEDDDAVRRAAKRLLRRSGYRVLEASGPAAATELSRGHRGEIHLLLSDIVMPGGSGPELARELQRERPTMKVLLMSGYAGESLGQDTVIPASVPFIQKPFTGDSLARKVGEVLDSPASGRA